MTKKEYTDITITEVVLEPEADGKFFTAICKVEGKESAVKIRGFADAAKCIRAGAKIRASWSDEYKKYFTVGESRSGGGGGGGFASKPARYADTKEGFMFHQRCIMAQNCLTNAIQFMHGLPPEQMAEKYKAENVVILAQVFLEKLWNAANAVPATSTTTETENEGDGYGTP